MFMHDSVLMTPDDVIESYDNDGYIYCIMPMKLNVVKIGKIGMKKNETEQQVIDKLIRRYNTYYPDFEILYFLRTGNCHKAELDIFESLKHLQYKREIYNYKEEDIKEAFKKAGEEYPSIQDIIEKMDVDILCKVNRILRDRV